MAIRLFKKKPVAPDRETDFQMVLNIVKRFDKKEFTKFMAGIGLAWQGYDKVLRTQTREEKEVEDITSAEKTIEFIEQQEKDNV